MPSLPIVLELCVELTFPVGEGMSVGVLYGGAQIWAAAIAFMNEISFGDSNGTYHQVQAFWIIIGLLSISFLISLIV